MKWRSSAVAMATAAVFAALIPVAGLQGLQEQEEETPTFILDPIVAVGSRAQPRSVTVSAVPVDVVPVQDFLRQGESDLTNQLRALVPSFNVNTQPISDAASIVRPANLRGLAPDHTLILVNGKRRHRAAVIAWLGNGIADGSQGPDLSVIPAVAIDQVEVLRDGASAQYGSDAIAGVLNFQLKNARSGGSIEVRGGTHLDENTGAAATCGSIGTSCNGIGGRANQYAVSGNVGLPMGETGFANLSFEYGGTDPTNRAIQRNDAAGLRSAGNTSVRNTAQVWGSPLIEDDLKLFGNFGTVFNDQLQWYGHTNYHTKKVTGGFYFRHPNNRSGVFGYFDDNNDNKEFDPGIDQRWLRVGDRQWAATGIANAGNCPRVAVSDDSNTFDQAAYSRVLANPNCFIFHQPFVGASTGVPGGFTPQFGGDVFDGSVVTGLRGLMFANLDWDLSVNWGRNTVDTFIFDTVNASLGPESPTSFRPNLLRQTALGFNLDTSYALSEMVNIAAGAEWREEEYHLGAGDRASWEIGPYAAQGFSSGSNGYNGTRPENSGSWARANVALYGDVELRGDDEAWNLGGALRVENFDGFGTTLNGKVSARVALSQAMALRGAVSTGFRAPTPGQQNAFNVTTEYNFDLGDLINKGTIPSTSPAAALRGGTDLEPEKSTNVSIGSVVNTGPFIFTADFFRINVSDRLTITKDFSLTPAETQSLIAGGFAEAANLQEFVFFVNDFATVTQGIDLVSTYATELFGGATLFTAVFNFTNTELTDFESETIDEDRRSSLERGIPRTRWNIGVSHAANLFTVSSRVSYYGSYWDREDARNWASVTLGDADLSPMYDLYAGKPLLDLEVGVPLDMGITLSVGAQNLLNTYPDKHPLAAGGTGNDYGQFGPFGFNGSYYFARVNYSWGSN
ncbi:MAG: TonB-dependent receptor [Gammaproteobacteria bacterium]|nr:TonB-dependent receptor [Gammaproteobacteria bacterium]